MSEQGKEREREREKWLSGWIDVRDRLPEEGVEVLALAYCEGREPLYFLARYGHPEGEPKGWYDDGGDLIGWRVMYWQPLPAPHDAAEPSSPTAQQWNGAVQPNGTVYDDATLIQLLRAEVSSAQAREEIYRKRLYDAGLNCTLDQEEVQKLAEIKMQSYPVYVSDVSAASAGEKAMHHGRNCFCNECDPPNAQTRPPAAPATERKPLVTFPMTGDISQGTYTVPATAGPEAARHTFTLDDTAVERIKELHQRVSELLSNLVVETGRFAELIEELQRQGNSIDAEGNVKNERAEHAEQRVAGLERERKHHDEYFVQEAIEKADLKERVAELEAALREIADGESMKLGYSSAQGRARAALERKEEKR